MPRGGNRFHTAMRVALVYKVHVGDGTLDEDLVGRHADAGDDTAPAGTSWYSDTQALQMLVANTDEDSQDGRWAAGR